MNNNTSKEMVNEPLNKLLKGKIIEAILRPERSCGATIKFTDGTIFEILYSDFYGEGFLNNEIVDVEGQYMLKDRK